MSTVSFSGMSSGLDTDSIVEAMCATAISKVTKSKQTEESITVKQNVWKDINSKIYSFYTGSAWKMTLSGTYSSSKTSSSSTSVATINSSSSLPVGNHSLSVEQLAEKASVATKKITYKDQAGAMQTADKKTKLEDVLGPGVSDTLTVNGKTITLTGDMDIAKLEEELSGALSNCNVKFNDSLGTFSIYSKETGNDQEIAIEVGSKSTTLLSQLGFNTQESSIVATGKKALATYNGMSIESSSNTVNVDGVEITLTGVGTTTLTSSKDTEGVADSIKTFVNEYNTLIEEISKLVDAEYSTLKPLTDDEKEEMTETEISEHNEKLEAAALRGDTTLKSLQSSLRQVMSDAKFTDENGNTITLKSIGITASSNWKDNGKLTIDEEKLQAALESNPDAVKGLFQDKDNGIATKVYEKLKTSFAGNTQKSTGCLYNDKALSKELKSQVSKTSTLEERLESLKDLYYSKFTAMETMLATINSQSSVISSYFSS